MTIVISVLLRLFALIYLFLSARSDLRTRQVRLLFPCLIAGAAIPVNLLLDAYPPTDLPYIFGGAAALFLVSFISHSAIGYGDDFVIFACLALLGPQEELLCLTCGLLCSAVLSAILLIRRKAGRKDTLPFLPFLFAGHVLVYLICLIRACFN